MNKVSVIIPVFNSKDCIGICLDSVLNQTYENIEIVVVDDGSTDGTSEILDDYASKHRMKLIHTFDMGVSSARNTGIRIATGELITFVDSDDMLFPDSVENLVKEGDLVIGNAGYELKDGLHDRECIARIKAEYMYKPNRNVVLGYCFGRMFKASIIRKHGIRFDEGISTYEDVGFNLEYLKHCETIRYVSSVVYRHTRHMGYKSQTMMMGGSPARLFGFMKVFDKLGYKGRAWVVLTIIGLVMLCGNMKLHNVVDILMYIFKLVRNRNVRENLKYYKPTKGEGRIVPILIRLKSTLLLALVCLIKARLRYG